MSYNYHIGVDCHKAYTQLVVQDCRSKLLRSGKVKDDQRDYERCEALERASTSSRQS